MTDLCPILAVDDDALLRDLVAHLVRRNRFCTVQTVSDGQAALEEIRYRQVQAAHPDLVERIVFMIGPTRSRRETK